VLSFEVALSDCQLKSLGGKYMYACILVIYSLLNSLYMYTYQFIMEQLSKPLNNLVLRNKVSETQYNPIPNSTKPNRPCGFMSKPKSKIRYVYILRHTVLLNLCFTRVVHLWSISVRADGGRGAVQLRSISRTCWCQSRRPPANCAMTDYLRKTRWRGYQAVRRHKAVRHRHLKIVRLISF
jgi:hypothetical protein